MPLLFPTCLMSTETQLTSCLGFPHPDGSPRCPDFPWTARENDGHRGSLGLQPPPPDWLALAHSTGTHHITGRGEGA